MGLADAMYTLPSFLKLGWKFYDADDYHSEENRMKMGRGVPLSDQVTLAMGVQDLCIMHPSLLARSLNFPMNSAPGVSYLLPYLMHSQPQFVAGF